MRGRRGASREAGGPGVWWRHDKRHARGLGQGLGAKGTRGAHREHVAHVCDAGGVPAGNVRVEAFEEAAELIITVIVTVIIIFEEGAHVGDGRDVPVGDRQQTSLSDANKLLIRWSWAGTSAFDIDARHNSGAWPSTGSCARVRDPHGMTALHFRKRSRCPGIAMLNEGRQ